MAHNHNGFVKYNQNIFSWQDQERLKIALDNAKKKRVNILITNANHASIKKLYDQFGEEKELARQSKVSGLNKGRGKTTELIFKSL